MLPSWRAGQPTAPSTPPPASGSTVPAAAAAPSPTPVRREGGNESALQKTPPHSVQRPSPVTTPTRASGPSAPIANASSSASSTPDDIPFGVFLLSFDLSAAEVNSVTRWAAARGVSDDVWRQPLKVLIARPAEWEFAPLSRRAAQLIQAAILPRNSVERVLVQKLSSMDDVAFVLQRLFDDRGIVPTDSATLKAMQAIALSSFFPDIGVVDTKNSLRAAFFAPDSIECLLLQYGVPAERLLSVVERCRCMGVPAQAGAAMRRALRLLFARDEALLQRDLGLTGSDLKKLQNIPEFGEYPISCTLALHSDWRAAYSALCELRNFDVDEDADDGGEADSPRSKLQQLMLDEEEWWEVEIDPESRELLRSTLSDPAAIAERERKRLENEVHRRELSDFLSGVATEASTSALRAAVESLLEGEFEDWEARLLDLVAHGMLDEFEPDALRAALLEYNEIECGVPMCDNKAAVMLRCGHSLCEECVQGIVRAKIGEQVVLIKCIGEKNCPEVIPHATIKRVLTLRDWERFESISQSVAISAITNNHYCVNNKMCTNVVDVEEFRANGNRRWVCDMCTQDQCIECVCNWHEEMTCEQYQKAREDRASEERLSEAAIKAMPTKRCPKCQRHKHYDGHRCAHVTCDCGAQWYWCCQRTYNARVGSEEQRLHNMLCCSNKWCFATFVTAAEQRAHTDTCKPPAPTAAQSGKPP